MLSRRRGTSRSGRTLLERLVELFRRGDGWPSAWRWCLRSLWAALLAAALLGSLEVRARVQEDERFQLANWRLEFEDLPAWVTPEIQEKMEAVGWEALGSQLSLFEVGVLRLVKDRLVTSPWIARVEDLRLHYPTEDSPGSLAVSVELRRPVAVVEQGGLYYLADAQATRLGAPYRDAPTDWFEVPAILGLHSPGLLPEEGEAWTSRDVRQGIEVARILLESGIRRDFPERPIQAIDLSNLHGRLDPRQGEILLWCGGQRLAWGRSPISSAPRTVPTEDIVHNLRLVLGAPETFAGYALIHLHRHRGDLTGVRG